MKFDPIFCRRMEVLLGKDTPSFFASLEKEPCRSFRFDPRLISRDEIEAILGKEAILGEVPFGENSLYFELDGIGNTPLHHAGAIYVQEPAAMAPVAALPKDFRANSILDLCAAPGG